MILAESTDGMTALVAVICTAIGGAATWVVSQLWYLRKEKRKEAKEDEKTINDHLERVNARFATDNDRLGRELREMQRVVVALTMHVTYLEGVMEARGIKFRPLQIDPSTGLPPSTGDTGRHRPIDPAEPPEEKAS